MTGKKFYIALALLVLRAFAQAGEQDSPNAAGKTRIDIAVAGEGTVSPSAGGTYEPGWKLSLRATPRTGSAFVGWYAIAADGLSTNALPGAYRNASYAYTVTAEPLTILARFVAKADDARFTVSCAPAADGYAAGEALSIPLAFDSITEVKSVTLKNAPAGVKYDAAKMALTGTPTKPGVYAVQFTARNAAAGTGTGQATVKVRNFVDAEVYPDLLDAYGPYMPGVVVTNDLAGVVAADSQVTGLPSGLSWNKSRCAIIGAATKPGTYTVMFTRTVDRVKHTASATFEVSALPVLKLERLGEGAGTVSGGGAFAANKKVTVRATAAAGSVFAGWYEDADATVPLRGSVDYRTASYALTMPAADETTLYARFIPKTADTNIAVACVWPDAGVDAGAAVDTPVLVTSETVPKVTVTGLPAGLKFDSKTLSFTGAATKPGVYTVTIKAVNASGYATTTTLVVK
ncbi:MAG: Ig domain-containing protein, partial [Kiritimatiellia bacterium]